jgi:phospholipid/cholesterol/gamma-HCH transport system substrate-binding protein
MKRRDEISVGALLIVALVLAFGGTLWIARGGLSRGYEMYSRFPWGAGLKPGQPVLLAGVNVGFVSNIALDPNGTIVVTMSIKREYKVPVNTTATVQANGIFGDQLIALTPVRASTQYLPEKDTIPTGVPAPGIAGLVAKGDSITSNANLLMATLRSEMVDSGGVREIRGLLRDATKLLAQITAVAAHQDKELTATQAQLRRTLAMIDSAKIDSTLKNFRSASANIELLTRNLDSTRVAVNGLVNEIRNGDGSVSMLMKDKGALYTRLNNVIANFDSIMVDIKKNPKKYINLRIF